MEIFIRLLVERLAEQPSYVLIIRLLLKPEVNQVVKELIERQGQSFAEILCRCLDLKLRDHPDLFIQIVPRYLSLPWEAALRQVDQRITK